MMYFAGAKACMVKRGAVDRWLVGHSYLLLPTTTYCYYNYYYHYYTITIVYPYLC